MSSTFQLKPLIISILISVGTGFLAAFFTQNSTELYQSINLPALSPPAYIFPIVWTILYILMGISAYLIYISNSPERYSALKI